MAVSWSPACHLRNVRCPVSGTTTRPSLSAWVAGARQATRPLVRRCSPLLAGLDDRHYGGGRQPTGLTANTPLRRPRSRAGAACSLSPPSPLLAAASEEGACDPRTWTTSSWPAPPGPTCRSDIRPPTRCAHRQNDNQVPPPHRRASPPQGDAWQAPVSRDLPPGWVGHPPCNGLPVYGDRAKGAGKRQKRPNKSL
jgi:hypothetical protein